MVLEWVGKRESEREERGGKKGQERGIASNRTALRERKIEKERDHMDEGREGEGGGEITQRKGHRRDA